jgi:hypothetical protein
MKAMKLLGKVSKYVTTGSKTALIDIIGLLCISLCSTVQLHDGIGSRHACSCSKAGFNTQNGDLA